MSLNLLLSFCLLLPYVIHVHCSRSARRESKNEKRAKKQVCEGMEKMSIFIPGFRTLGVLNQAKEDLHPRMLLLDITDSFDVQDSIAKFTVVITDYLKKFHARLSDMRIAGFVYQLDCFIDFMLFKPEQYSNQIEDVRKARLGIIKLIETNYSNRHLLLELVAVSPSSRVQSAIKEESVSRNVIPPMVCLQHVDYWSSLPFNDSFETLYLKSALIALLSSRLEDPSVSEHEKQYWFTEFADSFFWMSSTRVTMCIAAMLRAKRYMELNALQFSFTLEQWKNARNFMSPDELASIPKPFHGLVFDHCIKPLRLFMNNVLKDFKIRGNSNIAGFVSMIRKNATNLQNEYFKPFHQYLDVFDAFKKLDNLVDFSIAIAHLSIHPKNDGNFSRNFSWLIDLCACKTPVADFFAMASYYSMVNSSDTKISYIISTLIDKKRTSLDIEILFKPLCSASLVLIRNFRRVFTACRSIGDNDLRSILQTEDSWSLAKTTQTDLFLKLCELICKYDVNNDDLMGDLMIVDFVKILNSDRLSPTYKSILLEGVIGMNICQMKPFPGELFEVVSGSEKFFSPTVGRLFNVEKKSEISQFAIALKIIQKCFPNQPQYYSAAYAMLNWAILYRIMDDDAGADDVISMLRNDTNLQTNKQFRIIRNCALKMMLEYTSIDHLRTIIPRLDSCEFQFDKNIVGCPLFASRRTSLLSGLIDLELPSNYNMSLLLSVKQHVAENSIDVVDEFYAGKTTKLGPRKMAHAIVEAIIIIGQGRKKAVQLFPKAFLRFIFLGSAPSSRYGFFDNLCYELGLYLHLSLMPEVFKIKLIELLHIIDESEGEKGKMLMDNLQHDFTVDSNDSPISHPKFDAANKKEQTNGEPEPKKHSKPRPRGHIAELRPETSKRVVTGNSPSLVPESNSQNNATPKKQLSTVRDETNVELTRPSRTRPKPSIPKSNQVPNGNIETQPTKLEPPKVRDQKSAADQKRRFLEKIKDEENASNAVVQWSEIENSISPVNSSQLLKEDVEKEEKKKPFTLTIKSLRKSATIQPDGHVIPKDNISNEFKEYIEEEVGLGLLPFKLDKGFLSYLAKGDNKEKFKNTNFKTIRDWKERVVWRPKLHTPIRVFVGGVTMDQIAQLKNYVLQLTTEQIARLQSLCYFSSLALTNPDKSLKRPISRRTLRFIISSSLKSIRIENGMIMISAFPKSFQEFSNAIAILTESQAKDDSESVVITNSARTAKRAKVPKDKDEIKVGTNISEENEPLEKVALDVNVATVTCLQATSELNAIEAVLTVENSDSSSTPMKAFSASFSPKKGAENGSLLNYLNDFPKIRHQVTLENYKDMFLKYCSLLQSGVEYIALDCEMTGLYTKEDEAAHLRDQSLRWVDNEKQLIRAMDENMMFQLGLTIKARNGQLHIWSFFTAPDLSEKSFTPETFKFLFLNSHNSHAASDVKMCAALNKISQIAKQSVPVAPFLFPIFLHHIPIVLFSGYVDLMHVLKASGRKYKLTHEEIERQLECPFIDIKLNAKMIMKRSASLESLMQELYAGLNYDKQHLHDASYDSLLTALAFERLKAVHGPLLFINQVLFNYEKQ